MNLDRRTLSGLIIEAADRAVTEGVPPAIAHQLDDAHPVIPLAVDIDGDVAMVTLLTWTEQHSGWEPSLWNQDLVKHNDDWFPSSGSGGPWPRDYPLTTRRAADPPGLHIRVYQAGPQRRGGKAWRTGALQVSAEVETLHIGGRRRAVPFHGYMPVVARKLADAVVSAIGSDGSVLETIDLRKDPSDLYRELMHRDPDGWPFKNR
jgi:hypothetical protein